MTMTTTASAPTGVRSLDAHASHPATRPHRQIMQAPVLLRTASGLQHLARVPGQARDGFPAPAAQPQPVARMAAAGTVPDNGPAGPDGAGESTTLAVLLL